MKTLVYFLSEPVAVALGWTLLHALWQGFALVMPAALLLHVFRHKSSQLRYNVGVGVLLAQVALSVATFAWYYQPVLQTIRLSAKTGLIPVVSAPAVWPLVGRSLPWHLQTQLFLESHLTEIVLCWLIGVTVFLVRLAGGWLYVQRLKTTAVQPADAFWQSMLTRLSSRLAVGQSVRVLESVQVLVPMVVGALKPVILLPVGLAAGLSMREAEAILAHELAHVKRFDYGVNLLQSVVEVVFFFHPALWWLSARVREERENCCDDLAILACGDARSLAQALARVEEFSHTPALAMALASERKLLLNRVRRMLGMSVRPVVSNGNLLTLTLATVLLATVSVYAMQEQPKPKPKPKAVQPQSTRRLKTLDGTEFGITANRKVDYIVWKGQRLPAKRVANLQRQLDQVMSGQRSLDTVAQPDRDILLTIIETNQGLDDGMNAAAKGLAHLDYDNIVATTENNVFADMQAKLAELSEVHTSQMETKLAGLAEIDYNRAVDNRLIAEAQTQADLGAIGQHLTGNRDSLQAIREQNRSKVAVLRLQMEKHRFAVDAIRRKMDVFTYDKQRLEQQRLRETMKQRQILTKNRTAQSDTARQNSTRQIADSERAIQEHEAAMEKIYQQLIDLQNQLDEAQKPIRETEAQLRKLGAMDRQSYFMAAPNDEVAEVRGDEMIFSPQMPSMPEPPDAMSGFSVVPGVIINGSVNTPRRARRSSRSLNGAAVARPALPVSTPRPAIAPAPKPMGNARPAKTPTPAAAPRPVIVPNN